MIKNREILIAGIVLLGITYTLVNVLYYYKTKPLREKFIKETNYDAYLETKMLKFRQRLVGLGKMPQSDKQNRKLTFNNIDNGLLISKAFTKI